MNSQYTLTEKSKQLTSLYLKKLPPLKTQQSSLYRLTNKNINNKVNSKFKNEQLNEFLETESVRNNTEENKSCIYSKHNKNNTNKIYKRAFSNNEEKDFKSSIINIVNNGVRPDGQNVGFKVNINQYDIKYIMSSEFNHSDKCLTEGNFNNEANSKQIKKAKTIVENIKKSIKSIHSDDNKDNNGSNDSNTKVNIKKEGVIKDDKVRNNNKSSKFYINISKVTEQKKLSNNSNRNIIELENTPSFKLGSGIKHQNITTAQFNKNGNDNINETISSIASFKANENLNISTLSFNNKLNLKPDEKNVKEEEEVLIKERRERKRKTKKLTSSSIRIKGHNHHRRRSSMSLYKQSSDSSYTYVDESEDEEIIGNYLKTRVKVIIEDIINNYEEINLKPKKQKKYGNTLFPLKLNFSENEEENDFNNNDNSSIKDSQNPFISKNKRSHKANLEMELDNRSTNRRKSVITKKEKTKEIKVIINHNKYAPKLTKKIEEIERHNNHLKNAYTSKCFDYVEKLKDNRFNKDTKPNNLKANLTAKFKNYWLKCVQTIIFDSKMVENHNIKLLSNTNIIIDKKFTDHLIDRYYNIHNKIIYELFQNEFVYEFNDLGSKKDSPIKENTKLKKKKCTRMYKSISSLNDSKKLLDDFEKSLHLNNITLFTNFMKGYKSSTRIFSPKDPNSSKGLTVNLRNFAFEAKNLIKINDLIKRDVVNIKHNNNDDLIIQHLFNLEKDIEFNKINSENLNGRTRKSAVNFFNKQKSINKALTHSDESNIGATPKDTNNNNNKRRPTIITNRNEMQSLFFKSVPNAFKNTNNLQGPAPRKFNFLKDAFKTSKTQNNVLNEKFKVEVSLLSNKRNFVNLFKTIKHRTINKKLTNSKFPVKRRSSCFFRISTNALLQEDEDKIYNNNNNKSDLNRSSLSLSIISSDNKNVINILKSTF